jgi:acetate kinase
MPTNDLVLCINAGSSSLKAALHDGGDAGAAARVLVERIGDEVPDHSSAVSIALDQLDDAGLPDPLAVAHRIVHGGSELIDPVVIDDHIVARLDDLVPLAPLHLPPEIVAIRAMRTHRPELPQVACFDTAFHTTMPESAARLPLPEWAWDAGIRRYGFHGLSYEHLVRRIGADTLGRAVLAHLGNGASCCAVVDGRSVDTTMGMTPTGGLVMASRVGDLDPGVLVHLGRHHGLDPDALDRLVNHESGMAGLSGGRSDLRDLLERRAHDVRAALAVDVFVASVAGWIARLSTSLGGLDTIVFSGGIGEHAAPVRAEVCARLTHLGVVLDDERNAGADAVAAPVVSAASSRVAVRVVATDEEAELARHALALI